MKLGIIAGYSPATMSVPIDLIREAEAMGYASVWTAEAYGSDAVSPAAWILAQTTKIEVGTAIMQMPGRTPAMTAMTANAGTSGRRPTRSRATCRRRAPPLRLSRHVSRRRSPK